MKILVVNSGSSSVKWQLIESLGWRPLAGGNIERIGLPGGVKNHAEALQHVLRRISHSVHGIGHRVVHGGERYRNSVIVTPKVVSELKKLSQLAPLHNPPNRAGILACQTLLPGVKQVAVFDTAFYESLPEKAYLYAVPYEWYKKYGIRRYGFHGTNHRVSFLEAQKKLGRAKVKRTITCHLGNGCSITALLNGRPIETSMGFTPLEGIPMGTRSGDIDPSIIKFLLEKGWSAKKIFEVLNHESGLKGLSGISSDMRQIYAAVQKGNKRAKLALEVFIHRVVKYIGAYTALLSGLDCLIFTGGIGEHAGYVRKAVLKALRFLPKIKVLVIPANEELFIAKETARLLLK